jgi:NADH-quinone oxidoreductase subunit M
MFFTMASVGLPGTANFVGEFLSLGASTGVELGRADRDHRHHSGAAYMLYLYRRVAFGEQKNADAAAMPDLTVANICCSRRW